MPEQIGIFNNLAAIDGITVKKPVTDHSGYFQVEIVRPQAIIELSKAQQGVIKKGLDTLAVALGAASQSNLGGPLALSAQSINQSAAPGSILQEQGGLIDVLTQYFATSPVVTTAGILARLPTTRACRSPAVRSSARTATSRWSTASQSLSTWASRPSYRWVPPAQALGITFEPVSGKVLAATASSLIVKKSDIMAATGLSELSKLTLGGKSLTIAGGKGVGQERHDHRRKRGAGR